MVIRSGLILIVSGSFYVNPVQSDPYPKTKMCQICQAGANGLRGARKVKFQPLAAPMGAMNNLMNSRTTNRNL